MKVSEYVYCLLCVVCFSLGCTLGMLDAVNRQNDATWAVEFAQATVPEAAQPQLTVLAGDDARLFGRILPHVRAAAREQLQNDLKEANAELDAGKLGAPVGGVGGSVILGLLAGLVKKIIAAVLVALVLSLLLSLLWAYWYYPAGFVAIYLATTTLIANWRANAAVRSLKK